MKVAGRPVRAVGPGVRYAPFFNQLFAMGGTQFGIPLRGYDEFSITPRGFDPTAAAGLRTPGLRQVVFRDDG
jgi:hypothetical protein